MIVRYWGVRGSMPSPGRATMRYGGNTACVSIEVGSTMIVIGAGTGIRVLGKTLARSDQQIVLMLSHLHYDHVLGFPLFAPLFQEGRVINLVSFPTPGGSWTPLELMNGLHWPVTPPELRADLRIVEDARGLLAGLGVELTTMRVNHPGGALGFRLTAGTETFVHVPDNELEPPDPPQATLRDMTVFCRDATVLSHDAQYLDPDMPHREGWGHSLVLATCSLAVEAGVRHLVLFHHDPDRTDDELDRIGRMAAAQLGPDGIKSTVAFEGLTIDLANPDVAFPTDDEPDLID